ncbi:hypothetical protein [Prochlorococcus sp. MIT 1223]|uniref:hypothetical protein n=1 Tax=Prochlorococcus sp. MIT 1223 TaxID=3096217 RepID=UPI002A75D8B4|nr:hypothetical protein [Prochlorococcus sp. MIT 1223]
MSSLLRQNICDTPLDAFVESSVCNRCGGNGYTKSSPDCYKTCLECLGKGLLDPENKFS